MSKPLNRFSFRHLVISLGTLLSLTVVGTVGYSLIEGFSPLDSLFMTVITLSTVGYGEVEPLSPAGKVFSVFLIMTGLGAALYTVGVLAEFFLSGRLVGLLGERNMKSTIGAFKGHIIIVGMGRFGRQIVDELGSGTTFVVIEADESKEALLERLGLPYVIGSALDERVLEEAGVERARAIVVGTENDSDNVFIVLNAKELNPDIQVHARAESETGARRLKSSGANQVVIPHLLGGQRVANALTRPSVLDFIELSAPGSGNEIDLEEVMIQDGSALVGEPVDSVSSDGRVVVVGLKRRGQPMLLGPGRNEQLGALDRLVVVGKSSDLRQLSLEAEGP